MAKEPQRNNSGRAPADKVGGGRGGMGEAYKISTVPGIARGDLLNLELQVWACATAGENAAIRVRCWRAIRTADAAEGGQQNLVPFLELRAVIF